MNEAERANFEAAVKKYALPWFMSPSAEHATSTLEGVWRAGQGYGWHEGFDAGLAHAKKRRIFGVRKP